MNPRSRADYPADHVNELMARGYSRTSIALAAGLKPSSMARREKTGRCSRAVRDALLNVDLDRAPMQPAWRATRRLRSLVAAGVRPGTIAAKSGLSKPIIATLLHAHRTHVSLRVHQAVDRVWEEMKDQPVQPPAGRHAWRGWAVPWAWDDIDDPTIDLHASALIDATETTTAIRRAINEWGITATARVVDMEPNKLRKLLGQTVVRAATRDHIVPTLTHRRVALYSAQHRQEVAA